MNKLDMYKETPREFHNRIQGTLNDLKDEKVVHISPKKYFIVGAAVFILCSVFFVGAGKLFQWYDAAKERFDTEKELEDKLTLEGTVSAESDSDVKSGVEIKALQSVKKSNGYYLLAGFEWPDTLDWDENVIIEKSNMILESGTVDCSANFASVPDENGIVYLEIEVNGKQIPTGTETIKLVLENICRTEGSVVSDTLVKGTWEIGFDLPYNLETVSYETAQKLWINHHELVIDRIEMDGFGVKIYVPKDAAIHASYYSTIWLNAIEYLDGTVKSQIETPLSKLTAEDKDGNFYFYIPLENAVDTDKVSALVFTEGNENVTLNLGKQTLTDMSKAVGKEKKSYSLAEISGIEESEKFRIIYERADNAVVTDDKNVYLWDKKCDIATVIMRLEDYGYDKDNGGEIYAQQGSGGKTVIMKPYISSKKVYLWKLNSPEIIKNDAELVESENKE